VFVNETFGDFLKLFLIKSRVIHSDSGRAI